jgi:hypothetical protein
MSLQISEIGVRLAVCDPGEKRAAAMDGLPTAAGIGHMTPAQREDIVNECVRVVLQTLRMLEAR